jgi:hypothetical protein
MMEGRHALKLAGDDRVECSCGTVFEARTVKGYDSNPFRARRTMDANAARHMAAGNRRHSREVIAGALDPLPQDMSMDQYQELLLNYD